MRERLRRIEEDPTPKPPELMRLDAHFDVEGLQSDEIIRVEGVAKTFDGHRVLDNVSFVLRRRQRVVIVGPNGAGKTTLLNIVAGLEQPDTGSVRIVPTARPGILDQHARSLDPALSVLIAYRDGLNDYEHHIISDLLRHGLFTLDDLDKRVGELSAGQRRKLQVARLIAEQVNLLLLDEPTNHLSFDVLEEFEQALLDFPGPILAVSHDRWFIERFGGEVWELRDGGLIQHHDEAARVIASLMETAGVTQYELRGAA
jgi:macrolide transport system ATP-binding/permease protein